MKFHKLTLAILALLCTSFRAQQPAPQQSAKPGANHRPSAQLNHVDISISKEVAEKLLIKRVPVKLTGMLDAKGTMVYSATIDKSGHITKLDLINGAQVLDKYTREALMQWEYKPYMLNGEAIEVHTQITILVGWDSKN